MVSVPVTNIRERIVDVLSSDERLPLLTGLVHELVIFNRSAYPPSDSAAYEAVRPVIGINEIVHHLANDLTATTSGRGRHGGQHSLADDLRAYAEHWHCVDVWNSGLERAVASFTPIVPSHANDSQVTIDTLLATDNRAAVVAQLILTLVEVEQIPRPVVSSDRAVADFIGRNTCTTALLRVVITLVLRDLQHNERGESPDRDVRWLTDVANEHRCDRMLTFVFERALRRVA